MEDRHTDKIKDGSFYLKLHDKSNRKENIKSKMLSDGFEKNYHPIIIESRILEELILEFDVLHAKENQAREFIAWLQMELKVGS